MEVDDNFAAKLSAVFTQLCRAGVALRCAGLTSEAIKCFEALAMHDETYEAGLYAIELALCYEKLGDLDSAKRYCVIAANENSALYLEHADVNRILGNT